MRTLTQVAITQAVLAHFGDDSIKPVLPIPEDRQAMVLWVVDGLGLSHWRQAQSRGLLPEIDRANPVMLEAESVYPSTTAAGLASLAFAAPPAVHGALGYWIYLEQWGRTVNMLTGRDVDGHLAPANLLYPMQDTIFDRLARLHIDSSVVSPQPYHTTGLSRWLYAGAQYRPYESPEEAVNCTLRALDDGHRFIWLYWPDIDQWAHNTGMNSPATDGAIAQFSRAYGDAIKQWGSRHQVTIMVSADHGMMDLDPSRIMAQRDPRIQEVWEHPWAGERRALTTVLPFQQLHETLDLAADVVSQEQCWDEGWYGGAPAQPSFRQRVLNTLVLAPPHGQFAQDGRHDAPHLRAAHGGLSPDERTIPISLLTIP